jgi:hypothetical protein
MKIYSSQDFQKNAIKGVVTDPLAAAPSSPVVGQVYFDTALGGARWYDGTSWALKATDSALLNGQNAAYYLARANHTGTQLAATISDLATTVQGYRLDQFAAPTAAVAFNGQKATGLADPTNPQDAATKNYVDSQVSNAAAGIDSKPSVRLTTAGANDTLTGLAARDGVTPVAGDRVLVPSQTTGSQNGVYVAAAGAWTRATDADQTGEITPGATWYVEEGGTYGASTWRCGNTGTITLGTTSISITQFTGGTSYTNGNGLLLTGNSFSVKPSTGISVSAAGVAIDTTVVARKFAFTVGDGSAVNLAVVHNLGTKDVSVSVRLAATDEAILVDWTATDSNTVTLKFASAPAANAIKGVVVG